MTSTTTTLNETQIKSTLPIRLISKIVPGFGRGSKELGIPTANLSRTEMQSKIKFDSLPCGIYWGFARVIQSKEGEAYKGGAEGHEEGGEEEVYKAAISIGFNPHYGNEEKTIEPHLIAASNHPLRNASKCGETQFDDMYNQWIRLSVVGYLRPELPFEGIDKLILAIKGDIEQTEKLCDDSAVAATTADADTDVKQEQPEKPTKEEDLPRIERQWVASLLSV